MLIWSVLFAGSSPRAPSSPRTSVDAQTLLGSEMGQLLATTQEIAVIAPRVALALRPGIGDWRCALRQFHIDFARVRLGSRKALQLCLASNMLVALRAHHLQTGTP